MGRVDTSLRAYVDASYKDGRVGIGIVLYRGKDLEAIYAGSFYGQSSFYAEAIALKEAMSFVCDQLDQRKVLFLSDCQSCVNVVNMNDQEFTEKMERTTDFRTGFILQMIRNYTINSSKARVDWVRGHNKNIGNEYADYAAKRGRYVDGVKALYERSSGLNPPVLTKKSRPSFCVA